MVPTYMMYLWVRGGLGLDCPRGLDVGTRRVGLFAFNEQATYVLTYILPYVGEWYWKGARDVVYMWLHRGCVQDRVGVYLCTLTTYIHTMPGTSVWDSVIPLQHVDRSAVGPSATDGESSSSVDQGLRKTDERVRNWASRACMNVSDVLGALQFVNACLMYPRQGCEVRVVQRKNGLITLGGDADPNFESMCVDM